jgi:hypothetical protein
MAKFPRGRAFVSTKKILSNGCLGKLLVQALAQGNQTHARKDMRQLAYIAERHLDMLMSPESGGAQSRIRGHVLMSRNLVADPHLLLPLTNRQERGGGWDGRCVVCFVQFSTQYDVVATRDDQTNENSSWLSESQPRSRNND